MLEIRMPQKGLSEESAILTKWFVKPGDVVKANQYLFSVENGKATYDIETESDGVVLACFGEENDEIPIETVVCVIGNPGEKYESFPQKQSEKKESKILQESQGAVAIRKAEELTARESNALGKNDGRIFISPRARMKARELGINIQTLLATGPEGRIVEADVLKAVEAEKKTEPKKRNIDQNEIAEITIAEKQDGEFTVIPHSNIRKEIAKNMMNSLQSSAQLTLTAAFDCSSLIHCREMLNEDVMKFGIDKVTVNDMICFAVAKTVAGFPKINAHCFENELRTFRHVNLGIAVSTEQGLFVPVVKTADRMSLFGMIRENRRLIGLCREGKLSQAEMSGGTFTVTNLGTYGVRHFTPILNPPQVAILGVGSMVKRTEEIATEIHSYKEMELSLTIDHRGIDGADGAKFLKKLVNNLEQYEIVLAL